MTEMLEKKVSVLLAQIDRLESEAEEEFKKRVNFNSEIEELQKKIKRIDDELTEEKVHTQRLKFRVSELEDEVVSKLEHDKLKN